MLNSKAPLELTLDKFPQAITLVLEEIGLPRTELTELKRSITKDEEKIMAPSEACKMFDPVVTTRTLSNWSEQGLIRKHYLGGKTFYKRSEILDSLGKLKKYNVHKSVPYLK